MIPDKRTVDLGPGIPRVDIEPLDLPATEPEKCWLCNGSGEMLDSDRRTVPCYCCLRSQGERAVGGGLREPKGEGGPSTLPNTPGSRR